MAYKILVSVFDAEANAFEGLSALKADRIQKAMADADVGFEARLGTMRTQQAKAHARQQARIAARIDELQYSHEVRKAKLEDARRLAIKSVQATREAFAS